MKNSRVFISHAVKDKKLADMLVDLITACGLLAPEELFCTSLEGLGVPSGKDFLEVIKEELQEPDLVIALISGNYLNSHFCLCELGASWAMSHELLPILVPPLTYKDMSTVISTKQAILLNDGYSLNGMVKQVTSILSKPDVNNSRWEAKRDDFIGKFNKELSLCYEVVNPSKEVVVIEKKEVEDSYKEYKDLFLKAKSSEDKEDLIMIMLSEEPNFRASLDKISNALGIKRVVCQYHLDKLIDKDFIDLVSIQGLFGLHSSQENKLTLNGRHYLVEQGKV